MTASFTEGMARDILEAERSTTRFEKYCCDLFSELDGRTYVPTSWNYDQARDGKTTDLRTTRDSAEICASLREDVLNKAEEDAESRAAKGPPPDILRFCSNQRLTEKLADVVKAVFRKHMPAITSIEVTGTYQFPSLAVGHRTSFELHYLGELANLRAALGVSETDAAEIQLTGMRIALTTQLCGDAHLLREDLQVNLILTALADGTARTVGALCRDISTFLHLSRVVQAEYLQSSLEQMTSGGLMSLSGGSYSITDKGRSAVAARTEKGAEALITGQGLINALLKRLTGAEVDPRDFSKLWQTVQDETAAMFLRNGIYITESVASILKGQSQITDHHDLRDAVHALALQRTFRLTIAA